MTTASPSAESEARHAAVGTLQGFAASLVLIPTGIVTAAFLTRHLSPEQYGVLSVAITILVWIEGAVVMGIDRTAVRLLAAAKDWREPATRLAQAQLLLGFGAAALLFLSASGIAWLLRSPELEGPLQLAAVDLPFFALTGVHGALLIGRGQFGRRAIVQAVYFIARMVLILGVVGASPSVASAVVALIGASIVTLLLARAFVRPRLFARSQFPWRTIWVYAWPMLLFTLATNLFGSLDLLFVIAFSSQEGAAGYFAAAKNLTIIPISFASAFSPLVLAKVTAMSERGEGSAARAMASRSLRLTLCMLPFAAMSAGAAEEIVTLLYGAPYASAGVLLAWLIFAAVGSALIVLCGALLVAASRPTATMWVAVPIALVSCVAYPLAIAQSDSVGAAIATTGLAWFGALFAFALCRQRWFAASLLPTLLKCAVAGALAFALSVWWSTPGWAVLVKLLLASGLIALTLIVTRELDRGDLDFVRSLVRSPGGTSTL